MTDKMGFKRQCICVMTKDNRVYRELPTCYTWHILYNLFKTMWLYSVNSETRFRNNYRTLFVKLFLSLLNWIKFLTSYSRFVRCTNSRTTCTILFSLLNVAKHKICPWLCNYKLGKSMRMYFPSPVILYYFQCLLISKLNILEIKS